MSIFEALSFCTTRIECVAANGKGSTGTGFFFNIHEDIGKGISVPILITNKHVIENSVQGTFRFTEKGKDGIPLKSHIPIKLDNFEGLWVKHPDPDVDLCAMGVGVFLNQLSNEESNIPFFQAIPKSSLPTKQQLGELDALEEILMIGYPNGLWDSFNNKPIFRRGITATSVQNDYEGKSLFLIDAAVFPGSSGSPVFIANSGSYSSKGGLIVGNRLMLLGVNYAVFTHKAEGEIIQVPINQIINVPLTNVPNNLGIVIKSSKILDFESFFHM